MPECMAAHAQYVCTTHNCSTVLPLRGGVFLKYEAQSFLENENWSLEDLRNSQSSAQYANWKDNLPKGRLYSSAMLC